MRITDPPQAPVKPPTEIETGAWENEGGPPAPPPRSAFERLLDRVLVDAKRLLRHLLHPGAKPA